MATIVLTGVAACGGSNSVNEASSSTSATTLETTQVEGGYVAGRLIHSDELEPGHAVKYFEVSQGTHMAMETLKVGQVARLKPESATLKQMYADTMGDSRELPEALRVADEARARVALSRRDTPAQAASPEVLKQLQGENSREVALDSTACSIDEYGDNYGAGWFTQDVCQANGAKICVVNQGVYDQGQDNYAGYRSSKRFFWAQMEGDFAVAGHTWGYAFPGWGGPEEIVRLWNFKVWPRDVMRFSYTSQDNWLYGGRAQSPCGQAHVAARWGR